jgi:signal recognition particle receptor subunit beta
MQTVKMVVTGPFSAGKTQFIRSVSEIDVVATERKITSAGERAIKQATTVAMDFGRITVDEDLVLYPETFREGRSILETFRAYAPTPYVVAANKQDAPDAWDLEDMRHALRLSPKVKLLPCVATQKDTVKNVLLELLYSILAEMEGGTTS